MNIESVTIIYLELFKRFHFNSSAEDITKTRLFKYAENFTTKK